MSVTLFLSYKTSRTNSSVLHLTVFCVLFVQTFARPEAIAAKHADYAASITGKILSFFEKYFEINYQQKTLGKTSASRCDWTDVSIDGVSDRRGTVSGFFTTSENIRL